MCWSLWNFNLYRFRLKYGIACWKYVNRCEDMNTKKEKEFVDRKTTQCFVDTFSINGGEKNELNQIKSQLSAGGIFGWIS